MSSVAEDAGRGEAAAARRGPRRLVVVASLVVAVTAVIATLTIRVSTPSTAADTPVLNQPAPAFDLETVDGSRLSLAELRGSPVVINFWASWCPACRAEMPVLNAAEATYRSRALRMVGIVYQDSRENALAFMSQYGQAYPSLLDPDGRTAIDYGVFGVPETFFIDGAGVIRSRQVGPLTYADMQRQVEAIIP